MLGVLLIDKPLGISSHDVVNRVRRKLGTRRVGHAGTLDPLATGLLVVAVGSATRFLQYLPLEPKGYIAKIQFGSATSTFDREGEVTMSGPVPSDLPAALDAVLPSFRGLIEQVPPSYSAIKVNGQPLYRLARAGIEVTPETRRVHIAEIDVREIGESEITARIVCSGGTYIRSLAHDIGQALGCGAHLSGLIRDQVGRFYVTDAKDLDDISPRDLIPLHESLPPMPLVALTDDQVIDVRHGRPLGIANPPTPGMVALVDPAGRVVSVAKVVGSILHPECVIPAEVADAHV